MANVNDVKNQIAKAPQQKSIQTLIQESSKELGKALPAHMNPERLTRIALTCVRLNPDLALCTPESFLGALFTAAQVGLEPVAGQAHLLPFNNKKKRIGKDGREEWYSIKEVQFMIGYPGATALFYRHEKALGLSWGVVHENDEFDYEYGTNSFLRHKPAKTNRGKATDYWVMAEIAGGGKPLFKVMSVEECFEHGKKHSKTWDKSKNEFYKSSPWSTSFDSMALKTVLFQLAKILPKSIELQRALSADETSREYRAGIEDALDLPDQTNWTEAEYKDADLTDADKAAIEAEEKKQAGK